jgi:hypothetical protein
MTIDTDAVRTSWMAADGVNKNWPYELTLFNQSHVRVRVRDSDGVIVEHDTNLTMVSISDTEGHIVYPVTGSALAAGNDVQIVREVPYRQPVAIGAQGAFNPELHETALDLLSMQIQQNREDTVRAWKRPLDMVETEDEGRFLQLDAFGNAVPGLSEAEVDATVQQAIDAAAAAALSETAAELAETNAEASAVAAAASAAAAAASAAAAATAETNAELAETNAETAQAAAVVAKTAAETAETNAETAATAAQLAETNAETAQAAAAGSASAAATSATAAQTAQAAAEAAAGSVVPFRYNSQAVAAAATISASTDFILVGDKIYQRVTAAHPRLGPELLANGDFSNPASFVESGDTAVWNVAGGIATSVAGGAAFLIQNEALANGDRVFVQFDILSVTAGGARSVFGGSNTLGAIHSTIGTKSDVLTATGASTSIGLYSSGFSGTCDNISAKKLPADAFSSNGGTVWWAQPFPNARELDLVSMFGGVADGVDSLDPGAPTLVRGAWVTATAYAVNDLVWTGGLGYRCLVAHTSGTFATDLAASRWVVGAFSGTDNTPAFARMLAVHEATGIPMLVPKPGKYRMLNPSTTVDSAYLTLAGQIFDLILDGTLLIDEDGTAGKNYNLFKSSNFATVSAYNERKLFRIRGTGGFRGRWSHKPGGNTPNARAHVLAVAGYEYMHLEDFTYEDIAGSFSRVTKIDAVYANNVGGARVAKGGLRFHDTNDARITNNELRHHADDCIDLHGGTTKLRSRMYIAGNQLFDCETVIALGAQEISVIGNQSRFGKSGQFYIGGRAGSEGDNAAMMIVVSGNTIVNPLMASADGSTLADHDGTQAAIVVGSVQASWRAGDYNGASVNDPLSDDYYYNIDLDTTNVPQGGSIEVYGNPIRHTRPNATNFSEYGEGLLFHQDGWINPAVNWNKRVPNGVALLSDIENFHVSLNVSGFRSGAGILFRFLATTEAARNWSFRNGRVSGLVRDCLVGMSHSFWDGSAQNINFTVNFENLHCDLDPYHISAARSSATGGNWNSAAAAAAKNYGLRLASMRGFTVKGCSFKNAYSPVYGDTNFEYGLYRDNVIYGTRAIAGHNSSNFGVGDVPWSNDQFDYITVNSVPSAGAGTYDVAPVVVRREGSITLADDIATSFTPPRPQGTIRIVSNSNGLAADFAFDVASGVINAVGTSGSSVELGTAALANGGGTDVKVTYAAVSDGKIYISNRIGSSRTFRWKIIDG